MHVSVTASSLQQHVDVCCYVCARVGFSVQLRGHDVIGERCCQSSWRHDICQVHYVISDVNSDMRWRKMDGPDHQLFYSYTRSAALLIHCISTHSPVCVKLQLTRQTDKQTQHTHLCQILWWQDNTRWITPFSLKTVITKKCTTTENYRVAKITVSSSSSDINSDILIYYSKKAKKRSCWHGQQRTNTTDKQTQKTNGHVCCICLSVCPLDGVWHNATVHNALV